MEIGIDLSDTTSSSLTMELLESELGVTDVGGQGASDEETDRPDPESDAQARTPSGLIGGATG